MKMKMILQRIVFICFFLVTGKVNSLEYLHLDVSYPNGGMFYVFQCVGGLLYHYDQHQCAGVKIDFGTTGLYYDAKYGPNWWEYFCEPIELGKPGKRSIKKIGLGCVYYASLLQGGQVNKYEVNKLIKKYIKIKPAIQKQINEFVDQKFKNNFIISVHYRGSDKSKEAPRIPYITVIEGIKKFIKEKKLNDYRIYVATDEINFLKTMQDSFSGKILARDTIRGSGNEGLHFNKSYDRYRLGQEALIDCILLSKGKVLFKTPSNLSLWSTFFNPDMPVIQFHQGYM